MYGKLKDFLTQELANIKAAGLYKNERIITTPQRADIKVNAGSNVFLVDLRGSRNSPSGVRQG